MTINRFSDDYLKGNGEEQVQDSKPEMKVVQKKENNDKFVVTELKKIIVLEERYNLQDEQPEVLAGLLDDLSAQLKEKDYIGFLKNKYVMGALILGLSGIILYKVSRKK